MTSCPVQDYCQSQTAFYLSSLTHLTDEKVMLALKSPRKAAPTRFAVLLCRSMYLPLPWVYKPPTS